MARPTRNHLIDTADLTRTEGTLSGREPVRSLSRLASMLDADEPGDGVEWKLSGHREPQPDGGTQPWLSLHFDARVGMTCTRCLKPVELALAADRRFLLVADEVLAARADAETDDYDVLVGSRHFDVLDLVEDEVIMALPLVPRHAECTLPAQAGEGDPPPSPDEDVPQRAHPFAGLEALRRRR